MYFAISGNTGAGKSTLGRYLCDKLNKNIPIEYVDESLFHHEFIQQMFEKPSKYAFLMQMNFLVQRALKIKFLSENGKLFLIERSMDEDFLFAYRYYHLKNISVKDFIIYKKFWKLCINSVPTPSLYIYLSSDDPKLLTKRVIQGNKTGARTKELPDDDLYKYVCQMNELYKNWFSSLRKNKIEVPIFEGDLRKHNNFIKIANDVLAATKFKTINDKGKID